jgi:hypothetical protein
LRDLEQPRLRRQAAIAADAVYGPVACGGDQPARRVGGRTIARPSGGGNGKGVLGGLLGEVEVAEEADQGSEDLAPPVAENLLEND